MYEISMNWIIVLHRILFSLFTYIWMFISFAIYEVIGLLIIFVIHLATERKYLLQKDVNNLQSEFFWALFLRQARLDELLFTDLAVIVLIHFLEYVFS